MHFFQILNEALLYGGISAIALDAFLSIVLISSRRGLLAIPIMIKDYREKKVVFSGLLGFMRYLLIFGCICIGLSIIGYVITIVLKALSH